MKVFSSFKSAATKVSSSSSPSACSASPATPAPNSTLSIKSGSSSPAGPLPGYANQTVTPAAPEKPTAHTPEHTRPNSPELEDAASVRSVKNVPNPPACYWILPHTDVIRDPRDKTPPKKAHPDFPAIIVVQPDADGYIVNILTQTTKGTLAVTQDETKYSKPRDYKEFQSENLAKLLLIHYKRVQPSHIIEDDSVFMYDLHQLEMEHRVRRCVIDCSKRHKAFMSAFQATPAHKDTISHMVDKLDKLQKDEVLNLDYTVGHAVRQYRQVSSRVAVLYNGEASSRALAESIVMAWNDLNPALPKRGASFTAAAVQPTEHAKESEVALANAVNAYCTLEKTMLNFKSYLQLSAWNCTPEQQQVWGYPLKQLFDNLKPAYIQKYWVEYEHHFQYPSAEDALALVIRISDMTALRVFARFNDVRNAVEAELTKARATWEQLHPHLATPMTDAINQQFDTVILPQLINYYSNYYNSLRHHIQALLSAARRSPRGELLVQPLETLVAMIRAIDAKSADVSDLAALIALFGRQDLVSKHGLQHHVHLDAALVTSPQTALKVKKNRQTLLLFGPRLLAVEGALFYHNDPVLTVGHIPNALQQLGKSFLTVRRSWDVRTIALSLVASGNSGDPLVLEIIDSSYDKFEYRVEKGHVDSFLTKFDAVQAGFAFSKTGHDSGGDSGYVKVPTLGQDAVETLFVGVVEGVRNVHDMGAMFDHLVYCFPLGEADQKWTPNMCASMSMVMPSSDGGYSVMTHYLQQSGRSRLPTQVTTQVGTISQVASTVHKHISNYNCIFNATYASPNARIRSEAIRSRLLGHKAIAQITSGDFMVMKRRNMAGGTLDTASTASVKMPSIVHVLAQSTIRPIKDVVGSVRNSVRESLNPSHAETLPEKLKSPTKMEALLGSRGQATGAFGGTFGAGFGRPGSIAGSLNSIGSRLTTVGRMVMGKDSQLQGPATLQSVLFSACTYFMDLVISGVNLSMVPVNGAANASLEVIAPVGTSSKSQKTRWTMVHTPLLDELRKTGKFKPDLARSMFPMAAFNALAEYFSGVDAVISISQFYSLLDNVQGAVRTSVNFHNEIPPVINMLLEPIKDGGSNGQPTTGNLLKNENLRLFLFIVYLFEFSRIQFTDHLHLCFPQPTSSEPFQQLMATKISTSTFVMGALLKGSTGSSNRPADISLAKKLVVGLAAPAVADKLKSESKNKRIIGSPRALMDKLADMEKCVVSRLTAKKNEKVPLRSTVQMQEAAEEWRRWSEARNVEARAKATAAAKAAVALSAANKSVPSSPKVTATMIPDIFRTIPEVDSGAATLARPIPDVAGTQEQVALGCKLPLSRNGSDAAIDLRHATSSEATMTDQSHQPTSLDTCKVIDSLEAAVGQLSVVEQ